ncbi:F-box only protein, putative [Entamoeba dispar SAW760]|uniref:F-box only protein, putative n=1 Tax=Entamoeba dispar (strain ATCC PRA-260 / SAW760) TaxID=370354 RepID=B0E672_ENTDS|nr:F-box only protein, putative [Entamoeba dispar SAW760]EDR29957.1 F-box only protein, putative [Entamoeba dispar SAW760]|eukprot:EDR29957.1 F-box only protein, putative [Entamoeba dispar SAW760]
MGQVPSKKGMNKIYVGPKRKRQHIAEAVRNAQPNSYIFVESGKYEESEPIVIDKSVIIIGLVEEGGSNVVVKTDSSACVLMSTAEKVVIENIDFTTSASMKPVIDVQQGEIILEGCGICNGEEGIIMSPHSSSITMIKCNITQCSKVGIACNGEETSILIDKSTFRDCGTGISISQGSNPLISESLISQCGTGVYVTENGRGCIIDCTISLNKKPGILTHSGGNPVIINTKVIDGTSNGLFVKNKGKGVMIDCEISKNYLPGIASCEEGNPCIVHSNIKEGKNAGVFVYENGKGLFASCTMKENTMPGIEVRGSGNPIVVDSDISRGQSNGIYLHNKADGIFVRTSVTENALPGMAIRTGANPLVYDCNLVAGKDYALFVSDKGQGVIVNSTIEGCSAQPVGTQEGNCTIHGGKIIDGKKNNVQEWLEKIPEGLGLLAEDIPDFNLVQ